MGEREGSATWEFHLGLAATVLDCAEARITVACVMKDESAPRVRKRVIIYFGAYGPFLGHS